jgi:hypothetical protein
MTCVKQGDSSTTTHKGPENQGFEQIMLLWLIAVSRGYLGLSVPGVSHEWI